MKKLWIVIAVVVVVLIGIVGMATWVGSGHARMPLILIPVAMVNRAMNPEEVATIGEPVGEDSQAMAHPVSERFATKELQKFSTP